MDPRKRSNDKALPISFCDPFTVSGGGDPRRRTVLVNVPVVVGAGPSGLAVAACLKAKGLHCFLLERSDCIASLWKHRTYDRLHLHLPKRFSQLPYMPFPANFPAYPTKHQFLSYLEAYAKHFGIKPAFNQTVESADYDEDLGLCANIGLLCNCVLPAGLHVAGVRHRAQASATAEGSRRAEKRKLRTRSVRYMVSSSSSSSCSSSPGDRSNAEEVIAEKQRRSRRRHQTASLQAVWKV